MGEMQDWMVIVTGASGGIGRETAFRFASAGAAVVLVARDVGALEEAAQEVEARGGMDEEAYTAFLEHSASTHLLGRVGRPEEVAELIYFLASPRAGWITGVTIPIDGGRAETCAR
ncbi:MAG TPA: SDR family oxidoreductase [Chloroflexi bacterium]|nr:SDR family oxidoreductase [Chloroflexota bacterium]